jgi:predicted phage terminase large subunit-like protein
MHLTDALRKDIDPRLFATSEGRRALTKYDPLLFAAVYLPHKLKFPGADTITLNQFHLDICEYAKTWAAPLGKPGANRDVFIAPRSCGKSTWIFHLLPIWAAAHEHRKYIVAFSDSEDQAMAWLRNFKLELDSNELLQEDYPELCDTYKKTERSKAYLDNRNATQRGNGFVFQAKGVDSAILGANIGGRRPEVILFDDIEPPEANYGATELKKRKQTILTTHFYLNTFANVAFVGTTTMAGSLIDQMRKVGEAWDEFEGDPDTFKGTLDPELRWVVDANIKTHYYPAIIVDEDGTERSLWPEVWPLDEWEGVRGTREFAMNMMNKPISGDEGYWTDDDITIDRAEYGKTWLSIDPAVTTARRSDYTALAVLSAGKDRRIYVRHVEQVKGDPETIRDRAAALIEEYGVGLVLVETNQGGDLWKQVFKDIGCRVAYLKQRTKKEFRIAQCADLYKKDRVVHAGHLPLLEEQMLAYPNVAHDDLVDAVATGVLYFNRARGRVTAVNKTYMEVSR